MTRLGPLRVVIVHWNQADACIATVDRFRSREVPVRITVVDNGSEQDEVDVLRHALAQRDADGRGEVALIETGSNLGFGPGANVGLRHFLAGAEDGEWVALAPHDVDPFEGCLSGMLEVAAAEPMAGLLCADVGDGMTPVIDPYFGGMVIPADRPSSTTPRWDDAAYPHGTLMMLRRECLDEIGVFDERYFSYCEEAQLALRASAHGWRIGLIRGARVQNIHIGSGVAVVDYLQTRNTLLLVQESSGWYHAVIRACITLVQVARGILAPDTRPLIFDARARLIGLRDFIARRFGPPPPSVCVAPNRYDAMVHTASDPLEAGL